MKRSDAHHGAGVLPVMKYLLLVLTVVLVRQSVLAEDKKSSTKEEPALPLPAEPKVVKRFEKMLREHLD